ncbi:Nitrogen fixation transcriptional regulator protein, NifA [Neorhizobium galegae bv. officinalis]|uniref:nif-specific transcriptional activator NifA n=1 Tax=Neorhizobium galegae TaxID=399 RepID=UPI000621A8B0|nr:nif-specific transcriptional activator NifA [Neorhizobium galegae]MCQ1849246.1 nif-specific transcriptional activator NifA [Neorhizobium galegae]CDZ43265.1 Nitrogen fixation transcriptional regulator protein, NifA [Neorhizobium galegae bv. officinalis]
MTESPGKNEFGRDKRLIGIYRISNELVASTRLEVRLDSVLDIMCSVLPCRESAIQIPATNGEVGISASSKAGRGIPSITSRFVAPPTVKRIIDTGRPSVVEAKEKARLFKTSLLQSPDSATTFIGVPVKIENKVIAALWVDLVNDGLISYNYQEELAFLTAVANVVGTLHRLRSGVSSIERTTAENQKAGGERVYASPTHQKLDWIVGESVALREVLETVRKIAPTNSAVLLRGESGTGKEVFAKAIHALSPRHKKPFVAVNCAALSTGLLESELFGHEKGAFTGAVSERAGRFELADGGTLLLDEIGETGLDFQSKLLRVLQEGEFERMGGVKTRKVNVRLICATNKNLETAVMNGDFRSDLYYRINVVSIALPPLRDRSGDITSLANHFLEKFNKENDNNRKFNPDALDLLSKCAFPGNVRELENCVRRTATLAMENKIMPSDFACAKDQCFSSRLWKGVAPPSHFDITDPPHGRLMSTSDRAAFKAPLEKNRIVESELLMTALKTAGGNQAKAARILGKTARQISYAVRQHGVKLNEL